MNYQQIQRDLFKAHENFLKLERGLSPNSIEAYVRDVDKLHRFADDLGKSVLDITYDDLQQFVAQLRDIGIHPRSQARIISGIKSFYHYLVLENYLDADPTEFLESPKIGMRLPEVLSVDEINAILASIDLSKPEGHRNRAMLEVGAVYPRLGQGQQATPRPHLQDRPPRNPPLPARPRGHHPQVRLRGLPFPQPSRRGPHPRHGFHHRQAAGRARGHPQDRQPAHLPPLLRDAPPRGRGQPPRHPGDVRT